MSGKRKRTSSDAEGAALLAQLDALSDPPRASPTKSRSPAAKRKKVEPPLPPKAGPSTPKPTAQSLRPNLTKAGPSKAGPSQAGPPKAGPSKAVPRKLYQPAATPPTKRQKKVPEEKRPGRLRKSCTVAIAQRLERVLEQRFYMGELKEQFSVLGSTGNIYTVTIAQNPTCNCPDALKGNHCKHIIFIFIKVLQVPRHSGLWYQSGLLTSELEAIFNNAPTAPNAFVKHIQEAYERATGKGRQPASATAPAKKMPEEGDDCAICYDGMHGQAESALVWCSVCKNALHKGCFDQYKNSEMGRGKRSVNCVYCRSEWPTAAPAGGKARMSEGYVNIAHAVGISTKRDTSTCKLLFSPEGVCSTQWHP
ncbi:hypothetical protein BD626DRAFT_487919 [Schizophyllum amplum]|uniref:SWIM-type domain-containing protein n=1 Tax=Schizophyllum amplum TaxID=97359 RepID=A0A550CK72_9AGAR|nr:hypothetical protein BD626DRAFT_487919 [Auriculariopsis ampla]